MTEPGTPVTAASPTTMKGRFLAQDIHFQCPEFWTIEDADRDVAEVEAEAAAAARIGVPGEPHGYATGGNEPARPAHQDPLDPAVLAEALHILANREAIGVVAEGQSVRPCVAADHRVHASLIAAEYERLRAAAPESEGSTR